MTGQDRITGEWADVARSRGWEPLEPAPLRLDWWRLRCTGCGAEDVRQYAALAPCRHGRPLSPGQREAAQETARTAESRVRAAGWEPAEPFPGSLVAGWSLKCPECGNTVRRASTPSQVRPCTHRATAPPAEPDPAWHAWRERYESGETVGEDTEWLRRAGWEPAGAFPARAADPVPVRCIRCCAERALVLGDLVRDSAPLPACSHPGDRQPRPLTPQERSERRDDFKNLRDDRYGQEAAEAGWEPAEPRPAKTTSRWRLRCTGCGEEVYARVSHQEHTQPCPHRLTADEEKTTARFEAAGWAVLRHPVRGGLSTQWDIRCATCGHETRRKAAKKITPCTHPDSARETR
ncbi:hypothetical protein ACFWPV_09650 [Streptomyces uncialis]|uniref:hypothetical protein n=1 Tax=Streptomyces uncialis TaxID=1048205 RepID=UPI00365EBFBE